MKTRNWKQTIVTAAGALGILVLSLLFIFPTKDTQEGSRIVMQDVERSVYNIAYDDERLSRSEGVTLADADLIMLDEMNPRTGTKFTEAEVKRIKLLRDKFPDNELVPHVKSREEIRRDEIRDAAMKEMADRFNAGRASRADIDGYFDRKQKLLKDWRQLLELVVNEENWSPDVRSKYKQMLANTEKMSARIEKQRSTMLVRNGFGEVAQK